MSTSLFVGGLPYSTTQQALSDYFATAGKVISAKIIIDKFTGKSRGFGFVEMEDEKEAQKAIDMLNGKEFEGRTLTVNIARPRRERA
jgi:RNA recognition motif-containing protein